MNSLAVQVALKVRTAIYMICKWMDPMSAAKKRKAGTVLNSEIGLTRAAICSLKLQC
jgi:hypothetical protein